MMLFLKKHWVVLILFAIFVAGVFVRSYNIDFPVDGINPDEAVVAVNTILDTSATNDANTQSGYFGFLLSVSFAIFGVSIFSLKFVSIVIGSLTILLTYMATKQLLLFAQHNPYSRTRLHFSNMAIESSSLLSAGFIASNLLHIMVSRSVYDAVLVPFFLTGALAITFYSLRKQHLSGFLLTGVIWGVGCYASSLFTIALAICIGILMAIIISHRLKQRNKRLKDIHNSMIENEKNNILLLCTTLVIILTPLFIRGFSFFTENETTFIGNSGFISSVIGNLGKIMDILFINGIGEGSFNTLGASVVAQPLIPLSILGFLYIAWTLYYAVYHKNNTLIISQVILLVAIDVLLYPAVFTNNVDPLRMVIVLPIIAIISSYGFLMIIRLIAPNKNKRKKLWVPGFGIALVFVSGLFFLQYDLYFNKIAEQKSVSATNQKISNMHQFIKDQAKSTRIYIVVNSSSGYLNVPYPVSVRDGNEGDLPPDGYLTLLLQHIDKDLPDDIYYISHNEVPNIIYTPSIIMVMEKDQEVEDRLRQSYPLGIKGEQSNFWTYTIQ